MSREKSVEDSIFRNGSTTYYWSSKFFPKYAREDVFRLYSFVRVVDDYVDSIPQNSEGYMEVKTLWDEALKYDDYDTVVTDNDSINQRVVKNMAAVSKKYQFETEWVSAFFKSMDMDMSRRQYETIDEVLEYIYGSAEVIGLMMAKIMRLPEASFEAARMQGRAMQWINFLRDIDEDITLGRCYIPATDLKRFGIEQLTSQEAAKNIDKFRELIKFELDRYQEWQDIAYSGYAFIPKRLRVPLRTATDMYNWTAEQISKDPIVVFDRKVKPQKKQVIGTIGKNVFHG